MRERAHAEASYANAIDSGRAARAIGPHRSGSDDPVMFEHEGGPLAAFIVPVARFNEVLNRR